MEENDDIQQLGSLSSSSVTSIIDINNASRTTDSISKDDVSGALNWKVTINRCFQESQLQDLKVALQQKQERINILIIFPNILIISYSLYISYN